MTTILITGSSRGIGAAAHKALTQRGVQVIGHQSRARAGEHHSEHITADFTDPLAAGLLWEEAMDRSGGDICAVVNNAGLFDANPLDSSDIEWLDGWEDTLRINLTAAAQLSRFAVRHWQGTGAGAGADGIRGRLVHVASRAAYRGDSPAHWHYAAAKGGMIAMHKTIARAYGCPRHRQLRHNTRIYRHRDGGRLSGKPGRRRSARRYSAGPGCPTRRDRQHHRVLRA